MNCIERYERDTGMVRLYETGATMDEVGTRYGLTRQGVAYAFKRMGYKPRKQTGRPRKDSAGLV